MADPKTPAKINEGEKLLDLARRSRPGTSSGPTPTPPTPPGKPSPAR
jgi:hypothetical protein